MVTDMQPLIPSGQLSILTVDFKWLPGYTARSSVQCVKFILLPVKTHCSYHLSLEFYTPWNPDTWIGLHCLGLQFSLMMFCLWRNYCFNLGHHTSFPSPKLTACRALELSLPYYARQPLTTIFTVWQVLFLIMLKNQFSHQWQLTMCQVVIG